MHCDVKIPFDDCYARYLLINKILQVLEQLGGLKLSIRFQNLPEQLMWRSRGGD